MLMNLTLCSRFHPNSSLDSILALKQANAELLGSLIERFQQKYSLKVGYAEFLLQSIMSSASPEDTESTPQAVHPLCIYGCLLCLSQFGSHITKMILLQSDTQSNLEKLAFELKDRLEKD